MMGLVSAGCSSAANSRPNAALVAESKRSGGGASRLQEQLQSDISVGIHRGFG